MCGLLFTNNFNCSLARFNSALDLMEHRGPDARGVLIDARNGFALGHRRLQIVDLDKRSDQPFLSPDGRYAVVYNGEIYNYRELAKEFSVDLKTTSDTELLLALYIKLGVKVLDHLIGMFAFVIIDKSNGTYFAARDRLGVKPLYVYRSGAATIFCSEIAPILALTGTNNIDEFGVRQYKKLRAFFNGRTLYSEIKVFPPGCYELDGTRTQYWKLSSDEQVAPSEEELRSLIKSAVEYRCIADVRVGSYLSGGIDSTVVAALSNRPDTWVVGTESNNEFDYAAIAANHIGASHNEIRFNESGFLEMAGALIAKRGEPLSVPNEVLLYHMTKVVKTKNTVVLSGEGADELFFGYDRIFRWAASSPDFCLRDFDRLYSYGSHRDDEVLEDALAPFMSCGKPISIVASFFQVAHLHGLLRRLDNSTMQCSVEARVPFVDHRLIERMAGVSFDYRMKDGVVKAPLKRLFADLIPDEIVQRKKVGFPVDLVSIFGCQQGVGMDKWLNFNLACLGVND